MTKRMTAFFLALILALSACSENQPQASESGTEAEVTTTEPETTVTEPETTTTESEATTTEPEVTTIESETTTTESVITTTAAPTEEMGGNETLLLAVTENDSGYYDTKYLLTNISGETVEGIREILHEFGAFAGIDGMRINYPNGNVEMIDWAGGVPDLENSEQYFNALSAMDYDENCDLLAPGESMEIYTHTEGKAAVHTTAPQTTAAPKTTTVPQTTAVTKTTTVPKTTTAAQTTAPETAAPAPKTTTAAPTPALKQPEAYGSAKYKKVMPSDALLKRAVAERDGDGVYIAMDGDGNYRISDLDEMSAMQELVSVAELLTEEFYRMYLEMLDEYGTSFYGVTMYRPESYEDYVQYMLSQSPLLDAELFDKNGKLTKEPEIIFSLSLYGEAGIFSEEEIFTRAVKWLFALRAEEPDFEVMIRDCLSGGGCGTVSASARVSGGSTLSVQASTNFMNGDRPGYWEEEIGLEVSGGILLGDTFVPKDTEILFISSRDEFDAKLLARDFMPEDGVKVYRPESAKELIYDFRKIADALPNLKEFYMYQVHAVNTDAVADMKKLTALSYYVSDPDSEYLQIITESPFRSLKKLEKLRLYGEYESYDFLDGMDRLKELYVYVRGNADLESLLKYGAVTELEIDSVSEKNIPAMSKLDKLPNLKTLTIKTSADRIDFAAVARIKKLESFDFRTYGSDRAKISELTGMTRLKKLSCDECSGDDWGFLREMTSLEELNISYSNVRDSDLEGLPVTDLSLTSTRNSYSVLSNLPNLKTAFVSELIGDIDDFGGSDTLESYSEMFGDTGNYSVLAKCPRLKTVYLMGCNGTFDADDFTKMNSLENLSLDGTKALHPLSLGKLKNLKYLFVSDGVDSEQVEKLREMLPNCRVTSDAAFFRNST